MTLPPISASPGQARTRAVVLALARNLLRIGSARDDALGRDAEMFANPAWDVLLTVFVCGDEGLDPDRAAAASRVPDTVARRCITLLRARALVEHRDDRLRLTDKGSAMVSQALAG